MTQRAFRRQLTQYILYGRIVQVGNRNRVHASDQSSPPRPYHECGRLQKSCKVMGKMRGVRQVGYLLFETSNLKQGETRSSEYYFQLLRKICERKDRCAQTTSDKTNDIFSIEIGPCR